MTTGWLRGWKEIASYLGVHTRTAKRYFYELSMPVLQYPSVSALPHEIDIWKIEYDRLKKKEISQNEFDKRMRNLKNITRTSPE